MCQPQMCPGLSAAVAEKLDEKREPRFTELLSANGNLTDCLCLIQMLGTVCRGAMC